MGVRSHIGVQNVLKILFGADKGRSHKTGRSLVRGSLVAGTTVHTTQHPSVPGTFLQVLLKSDKRGLHLTLEICFRSYTTKRYYL